MKLSELIGAMRDIVANENRLVKGDTIADIELLVQNTEYGATRFTMFWGIRENGTAFYSIHSYKVGEWKSYWGKNEGIKGVYHITYDESGFGIKEIEKNN